MYLCRFGIHKKEIVHSVSRLQLIKDYLKNYLLSEFELIEIFKFIYTDIIYDGIIHDKVCIECGKCFLNIEKEKKYINKYYNKWIMKKERKILAQKIYFNNCGGK